MSDDDFFEADEPIEDLRAAWREGEPGTTEGTHTLEADVLARVERKAQDWDGGEAILTIVVETKQWFTPIAHRSEHPASSTSVTTKTLRLVPA